MEQIESMQVTEKLGKKNKIQIKLHLWRLILQLGKKVCLS